jgi:hypothetical protein
MLSNLRNINHVAPEKETKKAVVSYYSTRSRTGVFVSPSYSFLKDVKTKEKEEQVKRPRQPVTKPSNLKTKRIATTTAVAAKTTPTQPAPPTPMIRQIAPLPTMVVSRSKKREPTKKDIEELESIDRRLTELQMSCANKPNFFTKLFMHDLLLEMQNVLTNVNSPLYSHYYRHWESYYLKISDVE